MEHCAVQVIYDAAMNTKKVVAPRGKVIEYKESLKGNLPGTCYLCGCYTERGHVKNTIIKPTFTDNFFAKAPWSDVACDHCAWAISYMSLRNYSIVATQGTFYHPSRAELKEMLLEPPEPPFVICVAGSGQKWLHFKSRTNLRQARYLVRFEDMDVWVCPALFAEMLEVIEELYAQFNKTEIGTGAYKHHRILKFGLRRWEKLEKEVRNYRGRTLFELALFVAQKNDEETEEAEE